MGLSRSEIRLEEENLYKSLYEHEVPWIFDNRDFRIIRQCLKDQLHKDEIIKKLWASAKKG